MTDVKMIEIFRDSHLPEKGWIQSCFNCYIFTERNILFKNQHRTKKQQKRTNTTYFVQANEMKIFHQM